VQLVKDFRKGLPISQLKELLHECRTWISCDSFFQHLGWIEGKKGIVLWSVSDPLIYGHPENTNLLKDRKYLVGNQFLWWEAYDHNEETFVPAREVFKCL
jgi:ADP-heptose:LPS heptosyltransferase